MGPLVVVGVDEPVDESLQLGEGGGLVGLGTQPVLHRLLEAFDLAAGGGVVGGGVLLGDVQAAQLVFQGVAAAAAAGEASGEDHAVVGEGGGRDTVHGDGAAEGVQDDRAGHALPAGHVQGVAGAVVQPGQGLDVGAGLVGEPVVGEVGLPGLVGQRGLELDAPGWLIPSSWARSVTGRSPARSSARMSRRCDSAIALKTSDVVAARAMAAIVFLYRHTSTVENRASLVG